MKPCYSNIWKNGGGGQTFNYDGADAGTRNGSYAHYNPQTKVMMIIIKEKSNEPVNYKLSRRRMKTRVSELFDKPNRYICTLEERYCKKGFNYEFQYYYLTDKLPSTETMLKVREIVRDVDTEDMEDYLERKREEKLEIAQRHRNKVKNAENNLYF